MLPLVEPTKASTLSMLRDVGTTPCFLLIRCKELCLILISAAWTMSKLFALVFWLLTVLKLLALPGGVAS